MRKRWGQAAVASEAMDPFIDLVDTTPTSEELSPEVVTFTMLKWRDAPDGSRPLGQVVYTVRVTAEYHPCDDE